MDQAPAVALDVASDQSVEQLRSYLETNRGNTDTFTHSPTYHLYSL